MTSTVAIGIDPEEERLLRETVRSVCSPYGHDYFERKARERGNPRELWSALGNAGLLGVAIPEEFGGGGTGIAQLAIVTEEVAASGAPLMLLALSPAVCAATLSTFGTPDQKQMWLPALASGEAVMAFAITEPDAGSNSHNIRTTATKVDGGWRISGGKTYISHVDNAQAILVVAKVGSADSVNGREGLSLFIVDPQSDGLTAQDVSVEIVSPERQFTLFFDEVFTPDSSLVGEAGNGLQPLFAGLNPERIGSAALLNGIARYALDKASSYANSRNVWGVPIGTYQALAHPLARAQVLLDASQALTEKAAALYDAGLDASSASNSAKYLASETASSALDAAIQTHGGNGMATEYGLGTLLGLVRLFRIAPVSTEMALNHIARKRLGLPKSY